MYAIESTTFGFKMTFSGSMSVEDFERWLIDCNRQLASAPASFCVLADVRFMGPLPPRCQDILIRGQQALRARGLQRSAWVVSKGYVMTQLKIIALMSGIHLCERYLDSLARPNWEPEALAWLTSGLEPCSRDGQDGKDVP